MDGYWNMQADNPDGCEGPLLLLHIIITTNIISVILTGADIGEQRYKGAQELVGS